MIIITFNKSYLDTVLLNKKIKINKINFYFYLKYMSNSKKDLKCSFNNKKLISSTEFNINVIKKNCVIIIIIVSYTDVVLDN